ncbi:MAG: 4-hydroxy-tetrahydrodipicolinate synthase [Calditrichaeota bacterium]|nr:4-hydroxy-tetrahydrodipicolinate synthase [Calditrichota bacterium]MCB9369676.1 4-hydroxy-tetrahydrodipicolinate synthase [Calditrichota bacterium]
MNFYRGLWIAVVTPFKNGQIDEAALQNLVAGLANRGVDGFVPLGTTGEASCLSLEERRRVIQLVLEAADGCDVAPGCGTNATAQTIELVKEAKKLGAQGAMVITPYYNKPTQEGLAAHFEAVHNATDLPLLLYNVPGRTSVNMLPATVEKLSDLPRVASIKEASGNLEQISEIAARVEGRMTVLSGDDGLTLPILSVGGVGVVSVAGHVCPDLLRSMIDSYDRNDMPSARLLHQTLAPIAKAMFLETNPAPVKYALSAMGQIANEFRLPIVPVRKETEGKIRVAIAAYLENLNVA